MFSSSTIFRTNDWGNLNHLYTFCDERFDVYREYYGIILKLWRLAAAILGHRSRRWT